MRWPQVLDPDLLALDEAADAARQANVYGSFGPGVVDNTEKPPFLDLWQRPALEPRDRSQVTVAAPIAAGQPEQTTFRWPRGSPVAPN